MLDDDHVLAASLAEEAGSLLLALRTQMVDMTPRDIRTMADAKSHDFIVSRLASLRPMDAVLSEEGVDDTGRLSTSRVWIVDPLDGTREFGEGRSDWAVHVALVVDGYPEVGAVALPAMSTTFSTREPATVSRRHLGPIRLAVSRSRPPDFVERLVNELGAQPVPMGSAGAKAMAVVAGELDGYVHAGGQYEWDSAAPVAVAREAGLHVSRIDGSELVYNQADAWLPDLLICRAEIAEDVIRTVGAASPPPRAPAGR